MSREHYTQAHCDIDSDSQDEDFWLDMTDDRACPLRFALAQFLAAWRRGEKPDDANLKHVAWDVIDRETEKRARHLTEMARDREDEARMEMAQERLRNNA